VLPERFYLAQQYLVGFLCWRGKNHESLLHTISSNGLANHMRVSIRWLAHTVIEPASDHLEQERIRASLTRGLQQQPLSFCAHRALDYHL